MKNYMDQNLHHDAVQRALGLGRGTDPDALAELTGLLKMPSAEVRRLAASAIGKLAGFGADARVAVQALAPLALGDPHPQAQQYALKALKAYGAAASHYVHDLEDLAANQAAKDYVRRAAHSVVEAIRDAVRCEEAAPGTNARAADGRHRLRRTTAVRWLFSARFVMGVSMKCFWTAETSTRRSN